MHSIMLTKIFTVLDNAAALRNSEIKSNFKKEGIKGKGQRRGESQGDLADFASALSFSSLLRGNTQVKNKGNKNLTYNQRLKIESFLTAGLSKKQIAEKLQLDLSTIYKEIKRGMQEITKKTAYYYNYEKEYRYKKEIIYNADIAQQKYIFNCSARGAGLKIGKDIAFINYVEKRVLEDGLSPCAVLGEIKRNNLPFATRISKPTLYRYISMGLFANIKLTKRKREYKKVKAKRATKGTCIEQRPEEISSRKTFGHWEMDCVCGPTKDSLLVFSERLTRKELIFKIPAQQSKYVVRALNVLERRYGKTFRKVFKTITVDNGSEFADTDGMENSSYGKGVRTKIFYCHPYSSYERGTNERLNREIRRLLPKGTNLSHVSDTEVKRVQDWVNAYPREVLGYATSEELFNNQLALIG